MKSSALQIMADMAVWLIQQTALDLLIRPITPEERLMVSEGLPQPMYKGTSLPLASLICEAPLPLTSSPPSKLLHLSHLIHPFHPTPIASPRLPPSGNEAPMKALCLSQDSLRPVVLQPHVGWEFVDEGRPGKPKKGFISFAPGIVVVVLIMYCLCIYGLIQGSNKSLDLTSCRVDSEDPNRHLPGWERGHCHG